jgi:hypothetical protein
MATAAPAEIDALAEALLAAVAAAWPFGISPELIGAGVETFDLGPPQLTPELH